jgi:hypothetical protein
MRQVLGPADPGERAAHNLCVGGTGAAKCLSTSGAVAASSAVEWRTDLVTDATAKTAPRQHCFSPCSRCLLPGRREALSHNSVTAARPHLKGNSMSAGIRLRLPIGSRTQLFGAARQDKPTQVGQAQHNRSSLAASTSRLLCSECMPAD